MVEALGLVTWWGLQRLVRDPLRGRPGRAQTDAPAVNGPGRVLVVDDEPYITDVVTAALRFEGFASEEAVDRAEALDKARGGTAAT